jgi:hypothetical protein
MSAGDSVLRQGARSKGKEGKGKGKGFRPVCRGLDNVTVDVLKNSRDRADKFEVAHARKKRPG